MYCNAKMADLHIYLINNKDPSHKLEMAEETSEALYNFKSYKINNIFFI